MATPAAALVVPALKRHTSTIFVLHGLAIGNALYMVPLFGKTRWLMLTSGAGWLFLVENWRKRNKFEETKFIFPNAPTIRITMNGGWPMPGWYDIMSLSDIAQKEDEEGIVRSQKYIHSLIQKEIDSGIPADRIVLGGFSQGGAMSLLSGLTSPHKLGGVFGLSCYLLLKDKFRSLIPTENPNKDTPVFMAHGDADPVVRYVWGKQTAEQLKEWGWSIDFKTYRDLVHSADPEEIDDLERYIKQRLPPVGDDKKSENTL